MVIQEPMQYTRYEGAQKTMTDMSLFINFFLIEAEP